jgi:hypothetical protein
MGIPPTTTSDAEKCTTALLDVSFRALRLQQASAVQETIELFPSRLSSLPEVSTAMPYPDSDAHR